MRKKAFAIGIICLCAAVCSVSFSICLAADAAAAAQSGVDTPGVSPSAATYRQYLHFFLDYADNLSLKAAVAEPDLDSSDPAYHAEYQGRQGVVLLDSSSPQAIWTVRVEQEGLYNIALDYYPAAAKSQNITVAVKVNGESPTTKPKELRYPKSGVMS